MLPCFRLLQVVARYFSTCSTQITQAGFTETGFTEAGFTKSGITETGLTETVVAETGSTGTGLTETGFTETDVTESGVAVAEKQRSPKPIFHTFNRNKIYRNRFH